MADEELHANEQSSSMIEDMEEMPEKKEIDAKDILGDPFVKKAAELFSPKKIIVKSKV